jgi:hypothetical protein
LSAVTAIRDRALAEALIEGLRHAQNADGGWPSQPGRRSNTEITALAVLALQPAADLAASALLERGVAWLVPRQRPDGSWPISDGVPEPSWATSLAALALAGIPAERPRAVRGGRWLLGQSGRTLGWIASLLYRIAPERQRVQMNPDLKGWSWAAATTSWVEPTAYALLTLKKLRPEIGGEAIDRIAEGEQLLYDRMCEGGGWNYGTPKELGGPLTPYPEVTGVVLTALQDRASSNANQVSFASLPRQLDGNESGVALGWAVVCHSVCDRPSTGLVERLARSWARDAFHGGPRPMSVALLALTTRVAQVRIDHRA